MKITHDRVFYSAPIKIPTVVHFTGKYGPFFSVFSFDPAHHFDAGSQPADPHFITIALVVLAEERPGAKAWVAEPAYSE